MELQPGEEPIIKVIQPSAPQVVVDTTKKPKRELTEKQKAQLARARESRIAKRNAEKEAVARETSSNNSTTGSGLGGETAGAGDGDATTTDIPGDVGGSGIDMHVSHPSGTGDGASDVGVADTDGIVEPPKKKVRINDPVVASSTFNMDEKIINDPLLRDIRTGKRKPILWSCEPLSALEQAVIIKQ